MIKQAKYEVRNIHPTPHGGYLYEVHTPSGTLIMEGWRRGTREEVTKYAKELVAQMNRRLVGKNAPTSRILQSA